MSHFVYPAGTPSGTVPSNHVLESVDWQTNIQQVFKAINGDDGGTWAPGAFITVGGSGFQFTGTGHSLAASARLNVESTGEIRLKNGALLRADGSLADIRLEVDSNVAKLTVEDPAQFILSGVGTINGDVTFTTAGNGTATWQSGATATFASGSTLTASSGSTVTLAGTTTVSGAATVSGTGSVQVASGATVTGVSGSSMSWLGEAGFADLTLTAGSWVQFSTNRSWERRSLRIAWTTYHRGDTTYDPTDTTGPDAYTEVSDQGNTSCIRTALANAVGQLHAVEFCDLPQGGTVTEITVISKGIGATVTTYPRYYFVRWQDGDANYTTLSSLVTDAHSGSGNWDTTLDTTTITPNTTVTIDNAYKYGVVVFHPYYSSGSTGMRMYSCVITGTSDTMEV